MGVTGISCYIHREQFYQLGNCAADQMINSMFHLILQICSHVVGVLIVASLLDYGLKLISHQNRLRLTEQQLRDEQKMENSNRDAFTRHPNRASQ